MSQDLEMRRTAGMALESGRERAYQAYNEDAFRHFLAVEGRRAERSGRSLLLLLVEFRPDANGSSGVQEGLIDRLFSALNVCVREVDFIGWYRQGRVMAAVLTQGAVVPAPAVSAQIRERVAETLGDRLPASVARRLQVRVLQVRSSGKNGYVGQ